MVNKCNNFKKTIICFLAVFILGFGFMNVFWVYYKFENDLSKLNGLYDYKAATLGDGICLPLLIASLTYYILIKKTISKRQKVLSIIIGSICAVVGVLWQLNWLKNPNIGLNWTLPFAHHFNTAGWYHAIFFVLMFFLISMLLTRVWFVRANTRKDCTTHQEIISYSLIWLSGIGFLFLILLDDYIAKFPDEPLLIFVLILSILAATTFSMWSIRRFSYNCFICILAGCIIPFGLSFLILNPNFSSIQIVISIFLFSFTFITYNKHKRKLMFSYLLLITLPVLSLSFAFYSTSTNYRYLFCLFIIIIPTLISKAQIANESYLNQIENVQKKQIIQNKRNIVSRNIALGFANMMLYVTYLIAIEYINNVEIIEPILSLAISRIASDSIIQKFESIKFQENLYTKNINSNTYTKLKIVKGDIYFLISAIAIGILILLSNSLNFSLENQAQKSSNNYFIDRINILLLIILSITIITLLFLTRNKVFLKIKSKLMKFIIVFLGFLSYGSLIINFILLKPINTCKFNIVNICSIFMVIGSTVLLSTGFSSNTRKLNGANHNFLSKMLSIIIFIGTGMTLFIALSPTSNNHSSLINLLMASLFISVSNIIIPVILGCFVQVKIKRNMRIAIASPLSGIAQDGFLVWIINMIAGLIPNILIFYPNKYPQYNSISLILLAYWALAYCMRNNIELLSKSYEYYKNKIKIDSKNKSFYTKQFIELQKKLRFQNLFSFIALLVYSVIPLFEEIYMVFVKKEKFINKHNLEYLKGEGVFYNFKLIWASFIPRKII